MFWYYSDVFTKIDEKIEVAGVFKAGQFWPKKFQWRKKVWPVIATTLITRVKAAGDDRKIYSIETKGQICRLEFDRLNESWRIKEVYCE